MMYPAQRGGNTSPGTDERCCGEVDDIIAAAQYLAAQPGVDPARIYLGGHSTGGTKVILAAESSPMFSATFAIGPAAQITDYEAQYLTFDTQQEEEIALRSPIQWLTSLSSPLLAFEGSEGNAGSLAQLKAEASQKRVDKAHFCLIHNKDHFSVLAPTYKVIATKILQDTGKSCNITIDLKEL